MTRWSCTHCLAEIEPTARLARCDHGCEPDPGALGAPTLVFEPRERQTTGPRIGLARMLPGRSDERAVCPRCGKSTERWVCPECHADLPAEGRDSVASLVLVGPPGSGKTSLTRDLARGLERLALGSILDPHDEPSRAALGGGWTDRDAIHRVILHQRQRRGETISSRWFVLFDTPGGPWEERKESFAREAGFLGRAGAIALVIDPRRLEPVAGEIRRNPGAGLEPGPVSTWRRYQLVDEIRLLGSFVEAAGGRLPLPAPLAVVLTRLESWSGLASPGTLLRAMGAVPEALPSTRSVGRALHDEVEAELVRWNGESFLQQLGLKFPTHRFFPVGDPRASMAFGVEPLLRWILERQGWPDA
jgi:hypothetical protein